VVVVLFGEIGFTSHEGTGALWVLATQGVIRLPAALFSLTHTSFPVHVVKFANIKTFFESHGKYCVLLKQAKPLLHVLQAPWTLSLIKIVKKAIRIAAKIWRKKLTKLILCPVFLTSTFYEPKFSF
jgi:hypothetical protein